MTIFSSFYVLKITYFNFFLYYSYLIFYDYFLFVYLLYLLHFCNFIWENKTSILSFFLLSNHQIYFIIHHFNLIFIILLQFHFMCFLKGLNVKAIKIFWPIILGSIFLTHLKLTKHWHLNSFNFINLYLTNYFLKYLLLEP